MEQSPLLIIINPSAGTQEPILDLIGQVFHDSGITLEVHVLEEGEKASEVSKEALSSARMIAVYGGDGSITEAAAGLIGTNTPLAVIPGGTANVLAKELGIPQDTEEALRLIRDARYTLKKIDTGLVNGQPFLLRVNLGLMAEMVTQADPELKNQVGQLAYGVSALKSWASAKVKNYTLEIDGEPVAASGVALTITNSGGMGIGGLQLAHGIKMDDGLLDVVVLKEAGVLAVAGAAGSSLLGQESDSISHWSCREVKVSLDSDQVYICDDCEAQGKELLIKIVPLSLNIAVPVAHK